MSPRSTATMSTVRRVARTGEELLAVARAGDVVYAYVRTPGASDAAGGTVVKLAADGDIEWTSALPPEIATQGDAAAIDANEEVVVVAGGERVAVIEADDGTLRWSESVVSLGKSRGYALPGAVQHVVVADGLAFLAATPDS